MNVTRIYFPVVDCEYGAFGYTTKAKALAAGRRKLKKELKERPYLVKYPESELIDILEIPVKS